MREYVVYLDVFFLTNFIMDYFLLIVTSIAIKRQTGKLRIILSAMLGGIYSVLFLYSLDNHFINSAISNLIAGIIMVLIAFGYKNKKSFLKTAVSFFIITFLMSGMLNYIYYSTSAGKYINEVICGKTNRDVNTRRFLVSSYVTYISLNIGMNIYTRLKRSNCIYYDVKLVKNGKAVVAKALYDTGCSLREPVTGSIVHIVEYETIKPVLEGDEKAEQRIYVIPYNSVGKKDGILYAVKIDEMIVNREEQEVTIREPILAIYEGKLSGKGYYQIILNSEFY